MSEVNLRKIGVKKVKCDAITEGKRKQTTDGWFVRSASNRCLSEDGGRRQLGGDVVARREELQKVIQRQQRSFTLGGSIFTIQYGFTT